MQITTTIVDAMAITRRQLRFEDSPLVDSHGELKLVLEGGPTVRIEWSETDDLLTGASKTELWWQCWNGPTLHGLRADGLLVSVEGDLDAALRWLDAGLAAGLFSMC